MTEMEWQLDRYLSRYRGALGAKKELEEKKREIREEFENPMKGIQISDMPKCGGGESNVNERMVIKLEEIEEKLDKQCERCLEILDECLTLMRLLPEASTEYIVMTKRYVGGRRWEDIGDEMYMSPRAAQNYRIDGLKRILEHEEVIQKIKGLEEHNRKNVRSISQ